MHMGAGVYKHDINSANHILTEQQQNDQYRRAHCIGH